MQRWDKVQVAYHPIHHNIQYVYLPCVSHEEAARAYKNRKDLLRTSDLPLIIEAMPEPPALAHSKFIQRGIEPDRVLLLIEVPSSLSKSHLPSKTQVLPEFLKLAYSITGLDSGIFIEPSINPLSNNYSVREFYIILPDKTSCDLFYSAQPYMKHFVAHKLSHLIFCPFLRPTHDMCLTCTRTRECSHDFCADCCSRFATHPLRNCKLHDARNTPGFVSFSLQNARLLEISPAVVVSKIPEKIGKFHILIRYLLNEGIYTWFRPLFYTNYDKLLGPNQDLQSVVDTSANRANPTSNVPKKEGRLFTFLGCPPLTSELEGKKLLEGLDSYGNSFLEYSYYPFGKNDWTYTYDASSSYGVYNKQDFLDDNSHPGFNMKLSFHFFLAGLDPFKKGLKEVILSEIRNKLGRILIDDVVLLDKDSLYANLLLVDSSAENTLETFHRIACVKLRNETDSIKLILSEVTLALPLSNGHIGSPVIIPSSELNQYIHNQYEEYMRNPSHTIPEESISPDKLPTNTKPKRR